MMKRKLQRLIALAAALALTFTALPTAALGANTGSIPTHISAAHKGKTLRILTVGNSFSVDSLHYLYYMAKSAGYELVIGNLFHTKCSLYEHDENFQQKAKEYTYYKISNSNGAWGSKSQTSIQDAVTDEPWDLIVLQQASQQSGLPDTYGSNDWTCTVGKSTTIGETPPSSSSGENPPVQPEPDPEPEHPDTGGDPSTPEGGDEGSGSDGDNSAPEEGQPEPDNPDTGGDSSTPEEGDEGSGSDGDNAPSEEEQPEPEPAPVSEKSEPTLKQLSVEQNSNLRKEQTITCGIVEKGDTSSVSLRAQAKTELSYQSSNEQVATVDQEGRVTFRKSGSATITVTAAQSQDYYGAKCTVVFQNKQKSYIRRLQNSLKGICPNKNVRFGWNITWAYADGGSHVDSSFRQSYLNNYGGRQTAMYQAITSTVASAVQSAGGFSVYIPTGTAIQNLRSSYVGDTLNRDGVHLSYDLGRYTAAMTWAAALGIDISKITYLPTGSNAVSALDLDAVRESVKGALENPLQKTPSSYTTKPKLDNVAQCSLTNTADGIKLTWKKAPDATGYKIWRKAGTADSSSPYTLLQTITDGNVTAYTDKVVKSKDGSTYTYSIRAISGRYLMAPANQRQTIKRLGATSVSASNTADGIKLTWKKVTGAKGFRIYRSDSNGTKTLLKTVSSTVLTYTDKAVKSKNGSTYTYTVQPYYGDWVGADTGGKKVTRLTGVSLKKVSKYGSGIKLTWNRNSKAKGYYVYRKTGSGGWSRIKTISKNSTLTATDKSVKRGKTYYYKVYAYHQDGSVSPASNTKGIRR